MPNYDLMIREKTIDECTTILNTDLNYTTTLLFKH